MDEVKEYEDDLEEDDAKPSSVSRAEKSLGILTQRFVHLLQGARGGIVDLNIVSIFQRENFFYNQRLGYFQTCGVSVVSVDSRWTR